MPVFVDVRDVAAIHVASLNMRRVPDSQRFLVCGGKFTWAAVKDVHQYGGVSRDALSGVEKDFYEIGTKKVEDMLGVKWTPLVESVRDALLSLGIQTSVGRNGEEFARI